MNQQPQWYHPAHNVPAQTGSAPFDEHGVRVSDAERSDAITALGSHFAEGRLDLAEYEKRVDSATFAVERRELDALFADLPKLSADAHLMPMYSAAEIARVRRDGARPKAAAMGLTIIGSIAAAIVFQYAIFLLLIPTIFLLLYVAKLGPESWHMPSERKLEQQRLKALRMEHKYEIERRRQARRQHVDELTQSAMQYAKRSINERMNRPH